MFMAIPDQVKLNNQLVQRLLEKIVDVDVVASPFKVTDVTPDFWMLFLKPVDKGIYVGTLHNQGHYHPGKPDGIGETPYALLNRPNPETCNVPQEDMDKVIAALQYPTRSHIYYNDGTKVG